MALELVCGGLLKLGGQLGQVLIKELIGDTETQAEIGKNWNLLKHGALTKNIQRQKEREKNKES